MFKYMYVFCMHAKLFLCIRLCVYVCVYLCVYVSSYAYVLVCAYVYDEEISTHTHGHTIYTYE